MLSGDVPQPRRPPASCRARINGVTALGQPAPAGWYADPAGPGVSGTSTAPRGRARVLNCIDPTTSQGSGWPMDDEAAVGAVAGELVTETFEYDDGRKVTVYVPPDPAEAVVFAGDGHLTSQWAGVLEAAEAPSTMIVGVHRLSAGAVLPRKRDPVGGRAARCGCGRRHDRAGRISRRLVLAGRAPADGVVGVRTITRHNVWSALGRRRP